MSYIPLTVDVMSVVGIFESLEAMRLPKDTSFGDSDNIQGIIGKNDAKLAQNLIIAGDDHAKAMRGIFAYLRMKMQVGFMIEFETYRHGVECLSTSSSMHNELSSLHGIMLAERKQAGLPAKVYTRIVVMSYQALRNIYKARRYHRHPDWGIFCQVIEELPHFEKLIFPEGK